MKVIGMQSSHYIAVVSHDELEKCADKYYSSNNGRLQPLSLGGVFDIGAGYDFRSDIKSAVKGMEDATRGFERAQASLFKFSVLVRTLPEPPTTGETT